MNIIDKFSFWLINRPFMEMAYYRRDAIDKIRSLSGTILTHIVKIQSIDDPLNVRHWEKEVSDYLSKIEDITIKPKNRKLEKEEYYDLLFTEPYCLDGSDWHSYRLNERYVKMILARINGQYGTDLAPGDVDFERISKAFKEMAEALANYGETREIVAGLARRQA